MREDHERIAELLAVDALDGLDPDAARELADLRAVHGRDCGDCAVLEAEFAETAADLALTLPARRPSPGASDRLLAAVQAAPVELRTRRRTVRLATATAAAVVLVAAGFGIGYATHSGGDGNKPAIAGFLAEPNARLAAFPTGSGRSLALLYRPGHTRAWLVGAGLADPPDGRVYELWYQPAGQQRMHPAGTFRGGSVTQKTSIAAHSAVLAVSVEPHGGSAQPTTKPIYVLSLRS